MMSESLVYIVEANQAQDFTEYSIEVHHGGFIWTVKHRYSEFKEMHDMLRAKYPDLIEKNLLPPKKLFGKMSPTFIDKRRIELEAYLQAVLNKKYSCGIPRPLRQFLHFQYYDVEMLCQILAKALFETGDSILLSGSAYTFTPVQLWAITERLQQEKPPTDTEDPKFDFGHVLDFVQKLKHLHIKSEKGRVGTSNIITEKLTFDLSVFHSLQQVVVDGCSAGQVRCLSDLRYSVSSIGIHQSLTNLRTLLTEGYDTEDPQLTWRRLINADFSDNTIFSIDSSVKLLTCVEFLDLSTNKISKIENLENLSSLTFIDLSRNQIDEFDVAHARLGNVKTLILSDNKMRTLRGLGKLYSLEVLDISNNFIAEISEVDHIAKLPCLSKLNLSGNAITDDCDYRPQTLSRFGSRACEICLDQVPSTQKELDTAAVLYAILKSRRMSAHTTTFVSRDTITGKVISAPIKIKRQATLENMAMSAPGHLQTMSSRTPPPQDGFVPEKHKPLKATKQPDRRQLTNPDMSGYMKTSSLPEKRSRDGTLYEALEEPSQQANGSAPVRDHSMEIRIIDPQGESISDDPFGQDSSYKTLDDDGSEEVPSVYHSAFSSPVIFLDKEGADADTSLGASFLDVQSSSPRILDEHKHQELNAETSNSAQSLKGLDTFQPHAVSSFSSSPQSNEKQRFSDDVDITGSEEIAETELGKSKNLRNNDELGISSGLTNEEERRFLKLYREFKTVLFPTSFDSKMSEKRLSVNEDCNLDGELMYDEEAVRGSCSLKPMSCFWGYVEHQQDESGLSSDNNGEAAKKTPSIPEQNSASPVEIVTTESHHDQQHAMLNYDTSKEELREWKEFLSLFYDTSFQETRKPKAQEFVSLLEKSSLPKDTFTKSPASPLGITDADISLEVSFNEFSTAKKFFPKSENNIEEKLPAQFARSFEEVDKTSTSSEAKVFEDACAASKTCEVSDEVIDRENEINSGNELVLLHKDVALEETLFVDVESVSKEFAPSEVDGVLTTDACPQQHNLALELKYTDKDLSLMEKGDPTSCSLLSADTKDQTFGFTKEQKSVLVFQNESDDLVFREQVLSSSPRADAVAEKQVETIINKSLVILERKEELKKEESSHKNETNPISESGYNVCAANAMTNPASSSSSFDPSITIQDVKSNSLLASVSPEDNSDVALRKIEISFTDLPGSEQVVSSCVSTEDIVQCKDEAKPTLLKNSELDKQAQSFTQQDDIRESNPDPVSCISSKEEKQIPPQNDKEKCVQFSHSERNDTITIDKHAEIGRAINQLDNAVCNHGVQYENKPEGPSFSSTFESSSGVDPFSSLTDTATSHSTPEVAKNQDRDSEKRGSENTKGTHSVNKVLRFDGDQYVNFPSICLSLATKLQQSQATPPTEIIVKSLSQSKSLDLHPESTSCSSSNREIEPRSHEDNIQFFNTKSIGSGEQLNNRSKILKQNQEAGDSRSNSKPFRRQRRFSTDEDDLCVAPVMHLNFNSLSLSHLSSLSPSQYVNYQECNCFPQPDEQILYMVWSDVIFSDRPNTEVSCAVFLTNKCIHFVSDPSNDTACSSYTLGAFDRLKNPIHLSHTKFFFHDENYGRLVQIVLGLYSQCVRVMGSNPGEIATVVTRSAWLTRQFLKNLFSIVIDNDAFQVEAMSLLEHSESLTNEAIEDSITGLIVQLNNEEAMMEFNLLSVDSEKQQRGSVNPQLILYCLAKIVDDHFRKSPTTVILTTDLLCLCSEDLISYPLTSFDVSTPEFNRYRDLQTARLADIRCLQVSFVIGYDITIHVAPSDRACDASKWRLEFRDYCEREKLIHAIARQHRYICGRDINIFVGDKVDDEVS